MPFVLVNLSWQWMFSEIWANLKRKLTACLSASYDDHCRHMHLNSEVWPFNSMEQLIIGTHPHWVKQSSKSIECGFLICHNLAFVCVWTTLCLQSVKWHCAKPVNLNLYWLFNFLLCKDTTFLRCSFSSLEIWIRRKTDQRQAVGGWPDARVRLLLGCYLGSLWAVEV